MPLNESRQEEPAKTTQYGGPKNDASAIIVVDMQKSVKTALDNPARSQQPLLGNKHMITVIFFPPGEQTHQRLRYHCRSLVISFHFPPSLLVYKLLFAESIQQYMQQE